MLRADHNARFVYKSVGFFHKRRLWRFHAGKLCTINEWEESEYLTILESQKHIPVSIMRNGANNRRWWMFKDQFYCEDEGYTTEQIKALVLERLEQKERRINRAIAHINHTPVEADNLRKPIPNEVKMFVWQRDGGKCVKCGSQFKLEYDHIIPVVMGGSNTERNIQLLCEACNRSKGAGLV